MANLICNLKNYYKSHLSLVPLSINIMSYSWLVDVIVADILDAVDDDLDAAIVIVDAIRAAIEEEQEEEEENTEILSFTLSADGHTTPTKMKPYRTS